MDKAGDKTNEAMHKTADKTDQAADKSASTAQKAGHETEKALEKAGIKVEDDSKSTTGTTGTTGTTAKPATTKGKDDVIDVDANINDAWITTKVKTNFVNEDLLKGSDINVDSNNHVVTLKGTVDVRCRARAGGCARQEHQGRHPRRRRTDHRSREVRLVTPRACDCARRRATARRSPRRRAPPPGATTAPARSPSGRFPGRSPGSTAAV